MYQIIRTVETIRAPYSPGLPFQSSTPWQTVITRSQGWYWKDGSISNFTLRNCQTYSPSFSPSNASTIASIILQKLHLIDIYHLIFCHSSLFYLISFSSSPFSLSSLSNLFSKSGSIFFVSLSSAFKDEFSYCISCTLRFSRPISLDELAKCFFAVASSSRSYECWDFKVAIEFCNDLFYCEALWSYSCSLRHSA
jgi:hypothetical protein